MTASVDLSQLEKAGLYEKPKTKTTGSNELGQDAFLRLVLAQLENQDPMKPMENGDFIAQLAQMQSVSGIDDLNKSFKQFSADMRSNQALQGSAMVGRFVTVPSEHSMLWEGDIGLMGAMSLPVDSESVMVDIYNEAGEQVIQLDLKAQEEGTVEFYWDGLNKDGEPMPPGRYEITAKASIDGDYEQLDTFAVSQVDSVTLGKNGNGLTLNVNGVGGVELADVEKIM